MERAENDGSSNDASMHPRPSGTSGVNAGEINSGNGLALGRNTKCMDVPQGDFNGKARRFLQLITRGFTRGFVRYCDEITAKSGQPRPE
jgi:hypothetical protein